MRVVDLADELGLTTSATLDLCDRARVVAETGGDELTDDQVAAVRAAATAPPPPIAAVATGGLLPPPPSASAPPGYPHASYGSPPGYGPSAFPPAGYGPPPWGAPPPKAGTSPVVVIAVVIAAVVGLGFLALIAVSLLGTSAESKFETVGTAIDDGSSGSFDEPLGVNEVRSSALVVGDCIKNPPRGEVFAVNRVPCVLSHGAEVYAVLQHPAAPGEPFPGQEGITTYSEEVCLAAFESYVGVAYENSTLDVKFIRPEPAGWEERNDREITCLVADPDGPTLGSVKGTNR
jgi:hypothetical protein